MKKKSNPNKIGRFYLIFISFSFFFLIAAPAYAMTGIIDQNRNFAWGENTGWINFAPTDSSNNYVGLVITDTSISGYAWSSTYGWINFSPTNSEQGVTNTTQGVLGGSAWIAGLGWLDMNGVTIDSNGEFHGTAGTSRSQVGRVAFDCANCDVHTTWRPLAPPASPNPPVSPNPTPPASVSSQSNPPFGSNPPSNPGPVVTPQPILSFQTVLPAASRGLVALSPLDSAANVLTADSGTALPQELFDISLLLDSGTYIQGDAVTADVSLINFGQIATPVNMLFELQNSSGITVASTSATTTVQTQQSFRQKLQTAGLSPGEYTVVLHTKYGDNANSSFSQKFTLLPKSRMFSDFALWMWILTSLAVLFTFFFILFWKRRKKRRDEEEEQAPYQDYINNQQENS